MKQTALAFIFVFFCSNVFAQELVPVFGPLQTVTPTNANGSTRPRIALVNDSVPLVTWAKTGSVGSVFVAKWNGISFGSAMQISPTGLNIYCSADEGGDIAARGDTAYVVFFTTDSRSYCVHSYDGGSTWSDTVRINHLPMRDAYTPDVQIDRNGNPVVVFESSDMNMTNTAQMVCRSFDGGQTFSMEQPAHTNVNGVPCECCPPALLISDSMTYVIYRNNDNNRRDIVMTISSDSGNTFPVVSEVDQNSWTISSCPTAGADAAFYRDSIVLVWKSSNKIYYGCGQAATGMPGPDNLLEPALAASVLQKHPVVVTHGDTVIYLWDDRRTTNYDCYISILGDGVHSITVPAIINDTTGTAENGTQQTPHAAYDGSKLHIVYQNSVTGTVIYRQTTIGGTDVGVMESSGRAAVSIYPMPVEDGFRLMNVNGKSLVEIYDARGVLVCTVNGIVNGAVVPCRITESGYYTVRITDETGVQTSLPLIKQ